MCLVAFSAVKVWRWVLIILYVFTCRSCCHGEHAVAICIALQGPCMNMTWEHEVKLKCDFHVMKFHFWVHCTYIHTYIRTYIYTLNDYVKIPAVFSLYCAIVVCCLEACQLPLYFACHSVICLYFSPLTFGYMVMHTVQWALGNCTMSVFWPCIHACSYVLLCDQLLCFFTNNE